MSAATERAIAAILEQLADDAVAIGFDHGVNDGDNDTWAAVEDALRSIKLALKEARS